MKIAFRKKKISSEKKRIEVVHSHAAKDNLRIVMKIRI